MSRMQQTRAQLGALLDIMDDLARAASVYRSDGSGLAHVTYRGDAGCGA